MATLLSRPFLSFAAFGLLCVLPAARTYASDANSPEVRMREQLRATMLQLRDAQTQVATLQASQAESDQKIKTLSDQVDSLSKRLASDKDSSEKSIADLKAKLENREAKVAELGDALEKWKISQKQAAELAATKESQRAQLASQVISLQQHVTDQQAKNMAMFKLGNEILTRYEKLGLGEALLAREPFTGISRVKLKSLVQDYQDKLVDHRIKPSDASVPAQEKAGKTAQPQSKPSEAAPAKAAKSKAPEQKANS